MIEGKNKTGGKEQKKHRKQMEVEILDGSREQIWEQRIKMEAKNKNGSKEQRKHRIQMEVEILDGSREQNMDTKKDGSMA